MDSLDNLRQQMAKLDPNRESYNDMISNMASKALRFEEGNEQLENVLNTSRSSFNQINPRRSSQQKGPGQSLVYQIESKIKKIQDQYEASVIEQELLLEAHVAQGHFKAVCELLNRFEGLPKTDDTQESVGDQLENLRKSATSSEASLDDVYRFLSSFYRVREDLVIAFYQQCESQLEVASLQFQEKEAYFSRLDDLVHEQQETIDALNSAGEFIELLQPINDMFGKLQHTLGETAEKDIDQLKTSLYKGFLDSTLSVKELNTLCSVVQTNLQVMSESQTN